MKRNELDDLLQDTLKEVGLRQYQIAWSQNPAKLYVLVGDETKEVGIATRLPMRKVREVLEMIRVWGYQAEQFRRQKRERLNEGA